MLPADLQAAESQALAALRSALASEAGGRWTVELRFEGLRLLPVALRLARALAAESEARLLFPDAGAAALARRDGADLAERIGSFADQRRRRATGADDAGPLLLVGASQAEYGEVEALCGETRAAVVLLNPALEDAAVGIGSVARQRRRGFLSTWSPAYATLPLPGRALRRAHPDPWELYRLDPDGYRLAARFETRPDAEQQDEALTGQGASGLSAGLNALDALLEGLRH
ncbi:MAG: DUF1995 family protein [Synechococcaceae cyanobacterium]|nr:DUF1995 family protein [Synechococcaceae cyanobacterium]